MSNTITLPKRKVAKVNTSPRLYGYAVFQLSADSPQWNQVSKIYGHSTSAFAALGRLTQKDVLAQ